MLSFTKPIKMCCCYVSRKVRNINLKKYFFLKKFTFTRQATLSWLHGKWDSNKMEVTKKNFESVLASLPEIFDKAQFIAFDTEFTGLKVEGASGLNYFDTLEDLYLQDRLKAETFMAIQIGIVPFFFNNETKKYTHQAFNFYVFPSSLTDINFTCQSKSIEFLIQCGFDFNKVFKDGIPYLRNDEVEKLLQKLNDKYEKNAQVDNTNRLSTLEISPPQKLIVDNIIEKIQEILKTNSKECFTTERYNSFIRRLIYISVGNEFDSKVFVETNKNETVTISVGFTAEEMKEKKTQQFLSEKKEILNEVGFCNVVKLLIDSKKLIVGHNLLLDLLFIIKQFLAPLPNTYSEFKELLHYLFPKILDTKHMASTSEFKNVKDTSLPSLLEYFDSANGFPVVKAVEIGYVRDDKKVHEAAYDAYLTGLCFLAMSQNIGNLNLNKNIFNNLPQSPLLEDIFNKLSTPKLCDIFCMNIGGSDIEPDRLGVYHLSFPKEWNRDDITTLFKDCGFINISWINSTSAFIKVKKEYISIVEKNLMVSNSKYKICTHSEFRSQNQTNADLLLSPSMEKRVESKDSVNSNNFSPKVESNENKSKRKIEDIGEVIERPQKKKCTT